jgi:hypothetical protein
MKEASKRFQNPSIPEYRGQPPGVVTSLRSVATAFVQLQEKRHTADYDSGTFWTRVEALAQVAQAQRAFTLWKTIREEPAAQAYLMALLVKKRN